MCLHVENDEQNQVIYRFHSFEQRDNESGFLMSVSFTRVFQSIHLENLPIYKK